MGGGMTPGFLPEAVGLRHPQKQELQEREGSAVCLRAQQCSQDEGLGWRRSCYVWLSA